MVLDCYATMASKRKSQIEEAQQRLAEVLQADREYAPAILALANAEMLLKQTPAARNQLKWVIYSVLRVGVTVLAGDSAMPHQQSIRMSVSRLGLCLLICTSK